MRLDSGWSSKRHLADSAMHRLRMFHTSLTLSMITFKHEAYSLVM